MNAKPRPKWRPGAANKILVRRYRAIREGIDIIAKKKRAMMQKKKKIEVKPALIVTKTNGEYLVQMEVFKKYSKERLLHQYPYEDKPPLIYTIGKTEEEKRKIQNQKERRERRETRRKSRLLQSTFRDRCQEICLKAYNQAIGLLPLPNPNDPECPCHIEDKNISPPIDSCSCSEEGSISSSDTDDDEWVIEFTPPAARWDVKAKHPPILNENESQYTYLDYKVKLFDRYGNPVPRYFKGPDGKQQCSDLGGFWSPDKVWLEINKDGYIGPDNRWVPSNFLGPDGMFYSSDEGVFTDSSGRVLKIGIDGYVDKDGKWAWYSGSRARSPGSKQTSKTMTNVSRDKSPGQSGGKTQPKDKPAASPKPAGKNVKQAPQSALAKGGADKSKVKKAVSYSSGKAKNPLVMSVSVNFDRYKFTNSAVNNVTDAKRMEKYREIMEDLQMYDEMPELKFLGKVNRASNTLKKVYCPIQKKFPIHALNIVHSNDRSPSSYESI